jgi:hypothetical protein
VGNAAVLDANRHRPQPRRHVAQIVVGLGVNERPEDRAQAEIDAGIGRELFRRHGQRVERGDDQRTGPSIEREIASLFDQRPRQRLGEHALGQAERERLAFALVAALVAGDQRHHHVGAGPGMIGQILDGLADTFPGARLRQDQREIRRPIERMRTGVFCCRGVLAGKYRLRLGHPIIVLEAIGQEQRAARLLLGILGERDCRRIVGNGIERPGQIVAGAAQRRGAGRRDLEPVLLRAGRRMHGILSRGHAAFAGNIEIEFAGGAHHKRAADRNGNRLAGLTGLPRRIAGMHAGKNERRPAGIGRRGDPRVDPEIRRRHHALPIERRRNALPVFAAGGDEGGDASDQHEAA